MQKKQEEILETCLKEMFLRVGEKYPNPEFTKQPEWYRAKSWTEKEEENFRKWMIKYLRKNKIRKKDAESEVGMFLLQWGWTTIQKISIRGIIK